MSPNSSADPTFIIATIVFYNSCLTSDSESSSMCLYAFTLCFPVKRKNMNSTITLIIITIRDNPNNKNGYKYVTEILHFSELLNRSIIALLHPSNIGYNGFAKIYIRAS